MIKLKPSNIFPDCKKSYLNYMEEQYSIFTPEEILKEDLIELIHKDKGRKKLVRINILEKDPHFLLFESCSEVKGLTGTDNRLWVFKLIGDQWDLHRYFL